MSPPSSKAATMSEKTRGPGKIVHDSYGKSRVRLTKVIRRGEQHTLMELNVDIQLEGDFQDTYLTGDNSKVVATDSMKNTVYVLAASHDFHDIESFAKILASHFLDKYAQVNSTTVNIWQDLWQRIEVEGKQHPHSFYGAGGEKRVTSVHATREGITIESGIEDLRVVKTTNSEFWGFVRDKYTTLPEVRDRIFGTTVAASWLFDGDKYDFDKCYDIMRKAVLDVFASHVSLSVQQTLYEIGQTALERCNCISQITLTMPNQHRVPFNLAPLGLENRNEVFVTTDEPYGLISGTIARK